MPTTDRAFQREQRRITRFVKKWRQTLGLNQWRIEHTYHDGPFDVDGSTKSGAVGACTAHWEYQTAHLEFDVSELANYDDERVEEVVIHELMHAMVNEMRLQNLPTGWTRDAGDAAHEEHVVTMLTNAILYTAGAR